MRTLHAAILSLVLSVTAGAQGRLVPRPCPQPVPPPCREGRCPDVLPIPGTKRRVRLEENIAATRITLSDEELRAIDALLAPDAIAGARYPDSLMQLVNR